jgi:pimeloyl-ACP methyl ester carboxylesterase
MEPTSSADRPGATTPSEHDYREQVVPRDGHRIYAREYPGREPAIVLLHGFPDDLHLYDRLVPELAGRRVVTFDFLGWGASDKPTGHPYTAANQTGDLGAVLEHLQLGPVVLVAHATPSAHEAFFGLNRDLRSALAAGAVKAPRLREFDRPVRIVFGAADPYLNVGVARRFHELLPTSELVLVPGARHYVQMDEPGEVARQILAIPEG